LWNTKRTTAATPALSTEAQVALTLRLLGRLSTKEVARSFLVAEPTMATPLVRAKHKIRAAKIPYRVPEAHVLPDRLRPVPAVVYLIYSAGLARPAGPGLAAEARWTVPPPRWRRWTSWTWTPTTHITPTVRYPTAFMELMTERRFFPPASVWHLMPKLMGPGRPVGWLTVEDLAVITATAFSDPDHFIGREVMLASDVQSIEACRATWRGVTGRPPRRFPMPRWLFERFAGTDETTMWRWLGGNKVDFDTGPTLAIHPGALTVREWLGRKQAPVGPRR
jgi:hypothetical protein